MRPTLFGFIIINCLLGSGCYTSPDLDQIQAIVAREIEPAKIETTFKLSLGPISLPLGQLIMDWADVDEEPQEYKAELNHVEIGVHEISDLAMYKEE
ncbi:MAG: hypothetical protein ACE5OR_13295 [bacterium]